MSATLSVPSLLARAASLQDDLTIVLEHSRALVRRSWEVCLGGYPVIQPIGGGSPDHDAALVSGVIGDAALCPDCIAKKTGVPTQRIEAVLAAVGDHIKIVRRMDGCAACLGIKQVFQLANGAKLRTRDSILGFLTQNGGSTFCADCIATKLFSGKNIDVAMRHLEGYGVGRRHGRCSSCGKARLVAGLPRDGNSSSS